MLPEAVTGRLGRYRAVTRLAGEQKLPQGYLAFALDIDALLALAVQFLCQVRRREGQRIRPFSGKGGQGFRD